LHDADNSDADEVDELLAAVARIPPRDPARRSESDWTPPGELDEYRLIRPLGRGGMGSVWLAEDRLLERLVAVKFIAHAEPDKQTRERFAIEARAAARLQHLNVVTVHRYGEVSGRPYLISEYIRGEPLDKLAKPVTWERAHELGIALARGLAAAHRHGIVHRDIKPANAILTADGDAKLVDFGLAKLDHHDVPAVAASMAASNPALDRTALTQHGAIAGTPRYLAPEVREGEVASRRSDVYQIGCILYELVTARAPITDLIAAQASTVGDGIQPVVTGTSDVPTLIDRVPAAGARFAAVVDRCLQRDPQQRFASGDELREALEQIQPLVRGELPAGNPYRGLVAFEAEHRALFFGRDAEIRSVIDRLRTDSFVLVSGDSGVGKSSLCRAGALPRIADGAFGDGDTWKIVQLVPGQRPAATLISALADELDLDEDELAATLHDEPTALARELRRAIGAETGVVVFVDQLEELHTISQRDEATVFTAMLAELAAGTPRIRLLATVRSDFLTRMAELPAIGGEIARAIHLLRPLSAEGARAAVVGPAKATGVRFESEELIETLVGSVADETGLGARPVIELPLLAFTLAQLWEARDPETQTISARSLDAIGGVRGALARHADGVLDGLLSEQRVAARRILLRLVTADRTRARRSAPELAGFDRTALDALVRGRLVVARGTDEPTFELAHERLIDGWPTLAGWISETTEAIAVHARLTTATADWIRIARAKDGLWSARKLVDLAIVTPDDLSADEAAFVRASRSAARWRRWSRRGIVVAILLAGIAMYVGAKLVASRDLDRHIAAKVADANRALVHARDASTFGAKLRRDAFARFDAGDHDGAEPIWEVVRTRSDEAHRAYASAAAALESAFLLDTGRHEIRRQLAQLTRERLELAEREFRDSERTELEARLGVYDPGFAASLTSPGRLTVEVEPSTSTVELAAAEGRPLPATLAPGSYVVIAHAPGHATARIPFVMRPGAHEQLAVRLPPASAVPSGFLYVPAGTFRYGSSEDDTIRRFFGTAPMHEMTTGPYLIGRTEVTFAQWIEFLDDLPDEERHRRTPRIDTTGTVQTGRGLELRALEDGARELHIAPVLDTFSARAGEHIVYPERTTRTRQDWLQFPVSAISPEDAEAYAAWLDRTGRVRRARLCVEHEWERAARGADGRAYPHGNRISPDDANYDMTYGRRPGGFGPDEVGSHPASTSPHGLVDATGNVWEIARTLSRTDYVTRGGSFYADTMTVHLANKQFFPATDRHPHIGLRICADLP
jgi:serine/threonine protein kinase/formylglycine-generating enzyme required for sulfatase activity